MIKSTGLGERFFPPAEVGAVTSCARRAGVEATSVSPFEHRPRPAAISSNPSVAFGRYASGPIVSRVRRSARPRSHFAPKSLSSFFVGCRRTFCGFEQGIPGANDAYSAGRLLARSTIPRAKVDPRSETACHASGPSSGSCPEPLWLRSEVSWGMTVAPFETGRRPLCHPLTPFQAFERFPSRAEWPGNGCRATRRLKRTHKPSSALVGCDCRGFEDRWRSLSSAA